MSREEIEEFCREYGPEDTVLLDGYDEAFVGLTSDDGPTRAVYSMDRIIKVLEREMSNEDAWEYFAFNVESAHMGERTPTFIRTPT